MIGSRTDEHASPEVSEEPQTKPVKPIPVAIQRLIDEVREEKRAGKNGCYNRMHNRHNRGLSRR